MAIFVRCIDNTLVADVLVVGEIYEVMHINERAVIARRLIVWLSMRATVIWAIRT